MSTLIKLEKGPTDKAKEPDPGGSDQQDLGFKNSNFELHYSRSDRKIFFFSRSDRKRSNP